MKLREVVVNQRKKHLEFVSRTGEVYPLPFVKLSPRPSQRDPLVTAAVDRELGNEAVTFVLASGREGTVHVDQVLYYNRDPGYLAALVLHQLTVEAVERVNTAGISRRELARRLGTSVPQLYRLLDPANQSKNLAQLLALLQVLDCEVRLSVRSRRVPRSAPAPRRQRPAA